MMQSCGLEPDALAGITQGVELDSAAVIAVSGSSLEVVFRKERCTACVAVAFAYTPTVGDLVLVIRQQRQAFVIGVLHATGTTKVDVNGDLELRANGRVRLHGAEGVEISGKQVRLRTPLLEVLSTAIVQRCRTMMQRVGDALRVRAGSRQATIDGTDMLKTERTHMRSEKETVINAETVNVV